MERGKTPDLKLVVHIILLLNETSLWHLIRGIQRHWVVIMWENLFKRIVQKKKYDNRVWRWVQKHSLYSMAALGPVSQIKVLRGKDGEGQRCQRQHFWQKWSVWQRCQRQIWESWRKNFDASGLHENPVKIVRRPTHPSKKGKNSQQISFYQAKPFSSSRRHSASGTSTRRRSLPYAPWTMAFMGRAFDNLSLRILIWFNQQMVFGIMDTGLIRYHCTHFKVSQKSSVQSVCEEAAHTSERLRRLFGPKDSDTGTYFRQVIFEEIFSGNFWGKLAQVLGYAAGSKSQLESTAPELLEELASVLRPSCLQVTFSHSWYQSFPIP